MMQDADLIELHEYPDRAALAEALAQAVAADLRAAISESGRASLAVPGGTTPGPFLSALAAQPLAWETVTATLTDERQVPPDHPRANAGLLRRTLFAGAPQARFAPLYDPERDCAADLAALTPFSATVLGMGTDGHTASLFPGADRLAEALSPDAPPLIALSAPGAPEPRLSLSLPTLLSSQTLYLLITGAEKRAVLETALADGPAEAMPVRAALRGARAPIQVYYAA